MKTIAFFFLIVLSASFRISAQITANGITIHTNNIATGLDTPWEILWGPDDHIWFTERTGRISRVDPQSGIVEELLTIDEVYEESESGLLGMTLHPAFTENPWLYVVYNYYENDQIRERVVRYTYDEGELMTPLILLDNIPGNRTHNGSRIRFGPDGMLYFSLGDVSNSSTALNMESLNGKILRMTPDGEIPGDNPFGSSLVYTFGHRNPQGLIFTPDGRLYSSEHGPQNDDEVNRILAGENYGWPEVHGFCDESSEESYCNSENVVEPLAAWTPTLAVAGLEYYPEGYTVWEGALLLTSLKAGRMLSLHLDEPGNSIIEQQTWIDDQFGRLRDVCVSPGGRVFIATSNRDGRGDPGPDDDRIIELLPGDPSDIISHSPKNSIRIYPNPAANYLTVETKTHELPAELKIIDLQGRTVLTKTLYNLETTIEVGQLEVGLYWVVVGKTSPHLVGFKTY